jgi:hypothetical protein
MVRINFPMSFESCYQAQSDRTSRVPSSDARLSGVILRAVEIARRFMERAKTSSGLRVTVGLLAKVYATGRKDAADFKDTMKIVFDDHLPKWNYRALPQTE